MSCSTTTLRGPILNPLPSGTVEFHQNGALQWDEHGRITYIGDAAHLPATPARNVQSCGVILPPFLDCHIHIPQWPIRGRFCDGVVGCPAEGRLLAGLNRNVFPYEARCAEPVHTIETVAAFREDTLAHGVVGGAAYMTVHAPAVAQALHDLPATWSVGLVLMNMNCPAYLRTDETNLDRDVESLAREFGRRMIVTDRFAVAVDSPLRRRAVALAERFGLRTQTHLNEQLREKELVERTLYPDAASYTDVYARDGLPQREAIMAHCIHMRDAEFDQLAAAGAVIAHCPTSNSLLGSGIMRLDGVIDRNIPYAICTDVGASPTTSILCEMAQFLKVHAGRSRRATPSEALVRTTIKAAEMLGLADQLGTFAPGRPASFIEVDCDVDALRGASADEAILTALLAMNQSGPPARPEFESLAKGSLDTGAELDWITNDFNAAAERLDRKVNRVTLEGQSAWERTTAK
ncbi:MAG TPA: amidohydrolase family protein [Tepidisphaeraceae bacterium]|nr:amidohydrolase family protein [Tepidisphaeraceae bacterium]